ncbi:Ca2+-binding RTX toxin-like protein [Rhizobium leguminosarum]|uniref:Ca2+-binding RTX toxin-like protein n=1 Tax=Rhizobium leguminosarum TaxID=384 RepID=A0AAE2MJP1_RHILE|nr:MULTISPECIES: calcium-binding protein [Rhizobium]MBB4290362.1 Ca2+-binding RTX toxin-like protein [Rhizobium leguminosarum]MBB4297005.1 Ca2+-binding RTX toxin-like protein [Rhizobium leguminosarum]MBB4307733.1 Ca2+-binding RTX toxin-like protein [Rhizobium leguminosarum]MBB4415569.1 Ca2+-binding RTX toxin-like protein [Rhizobium leguminosarum]MBB4431465.1 Ca2+-binding RTX toxin-like protein [Rhizobium esperanzae]
MAQALRINDIIRSFGIDTHIDYTDGKYSNVGEVVKALDYLGLDTVRDHAPNSASDPNGQTHLGNAADAGVQFVFSAQREVDPATVAQRLHAFVEAHPGSVVGIEGPNEVNNWPVSYHGLSGQAAALAYQKDLSAAVNADPLLKDIPVLGFTGYTVASASDYTTIHTYAKDGDQPYSWLSRESGVQRAADPGKPLAITETGYHTSLTADTNGGWEGVNEAAQAKLLLNTLMDGAALGSKQTFLYELLDAYSDPQGTNQEKHFGLFHLDYSAKPAATAIHNLTEILADDGAQKASFSAGTLNYSIDGLPSSARSLLTEKSDGSYQIIIWNEPDIWNQSTDTAIQAATTGVKVNLGTSFGSVKVFDPLTGSTAIKSLSNVSSLTVELVDHPVIIEVAGSGGTPPATGHVYGGAGNDTFTVTNPTQIVDESKGGGTDTVMSSISFSLKDTAHAIGNIENLTLTGATNINGTGNALANVLVGNSGNNILDGSTGADRMSGHAGNDTYVIDNTGDFADETGASGRDTVKASTSFSLADLQRTAGTIENLTLTGTANLSATGNNTANVLTGNDGSNTINGGKGADQLTGGLGNDKLIGKAGADILTGGGGADSFVFDVKPDNLSVDKIRDFSSAAGDKLLFDHTIFAALSLSKFSDENFVLGTKALEADDRLIYDQTGGTLSFDADGSAAGSAVHVADLDKSPALHFSDFQLL